MFPSRCGTNTIPSPVRLPAGALRELRRLARAGYPYEVCGLLVGKSDDSGTRVERITEARNRVTDRRADRYLLDPGDFVAADRDARRDGFDIVGVWHTHPDHPARPSATDLASAWNDYTYLILSVRRDGVAAVTAWLLEGERFVERPVEELAP